MSKDNAGPLYCVTGSLCRMDCNPQKRECEGFSIPAYKDCPRKYFFIEAKRALVDRSESPSRDAIIEECARVCDEIKAREYAYEYQLRISGIGAAADCATAIRALKKPEAA